MKKKLDTTKENQSRSPQKPATVGRVKMDSQDIISLILHDHEPLKVLIEELKNPDIEKADKEDSLETFVLKLTAHAKAEEQTMYVQMKEFKDLRVESFEGDTEHAIAEQLVHEINSSPDDDEWTAKVKVLAELVESHIKEEEEEVLPNVEKRMNASLRKEVGAEYIAKKDELDMLKGASQMKPAQSELTH